MKHTDTGPSFPQLPSRWGSEERGFALALRNLFEQNRWQRAYPVGIVTLTTKEKRPFTFGEWEQVNTGISGVYGWKRVK